MNYRFWETGSSRVLIPPRWTRGVGSTGEVPLFSGYSVGIIFRRFRISLSFLFYTLFSHAHATWQKGKNLLMCYTIRSAMELQTGESDESVRILIMH